MDYKSTLLNSHQPEEDIQMVDLTDTKSHSPSLDLYLMQTLKNKQTLIFNVVGTYINQNNKRTYREQLADAYLTDVYSEVDGEKYSFIGEVSYEKEWKAGRLGAGVKHSQASSNNDYRGTVSYQTKMQQSNTYAYTQFSGSAGKLNYSVGVGLNRDWLKQEGQEGYQIYTFRPRLTLNYAPTQNFYVRLGGQVENVAPSLSELSAVEQYIDSWQKQRGNPALNPYQLYKLDFNTEYRFGKFAVSAWAAYMNMPKAIMPTITREEGMFVHSFENQKRMQKLWSLMFNQYSAFNNFWGEQALGGENGQELLVTYRHKG